jgi:hypothetical protein
LQRGLRESFRANRRKQRADRRICQVKSDPSCGRSRFIAE